MDLKTWHLLFLIGTFIFIIKCTDTATQATEQTPEADANAPTLIAPEVNSDQSTSVTLQWGKLDNVDSFELRISDSKDFKSTILDSTVDSTTVNLKDLPQDTTIYWKVNAYSGGHRTRWSKIWHFTTHHRRAGSTLAAPTQVAPSDTGEDVALKPTFKWEAVDGADEYEVHVSHGDETLIKKKIDDNALTTRQRLTAGTTYYWRVRGIDGSTNGNWSEVESFTTGTPQGSTTEAVSLSTPSDGASGQSTSLSLKWEAVSGIDQYRVEVADNSAFSAPATDKTTDANAYEVSGLDNDQTYYWRVQAAGDGDSGNWSSARSFRTEAASTGDTGNVASEREALMDLYNATGGPQWTNHSGWGQGDPSNSWHGIQVDSQGHVARIDLFKNGLTGQLPNSIGSLKNVKYLNLKNNKLTGAIPASIGNMESLQYLILSGRTYEIGGTLKEPPQNLEFAYHAGKYNSGTNNFSGTIPANIGNLSNLEFLEISCQKNITGPIPSEIGNLRNLKGLYLNYDNFDGYTVPNSFGNLTELRHLYISRSNVTGSLPASLKNLTKLTYLDIVSTETRGKGLTGDLPDMSNYKNLRSIGLDNNQLTGEFPAYFNNGNFTQMHTLRIAWNHLTGTFHGFDNMPALESLGLEGNNLSGDIGNMLTQLPDRLQIMGLGWNNFSGTLPQSGWPDFWQLKTLYLNDNNFTGGIPCDLWQKIDNPRLGITWLKNNGFTSNCASSMNSIAGNTTGSTANLNIDVSGNNF